MIPKHYYILLILILTSSLASCRPELSSVVPTDHGHDQDSIFVPSKMSVDELATWVNVHKGMIAFDTDNQLLKYFDGTKWDACSNLTGNTPTKKNLVSPNLTKPDNIFQIGWFRNRWYIAKSLTTLPYWYAASFTEDDLDIVKFGKVVESRRKIISKVSDELFAHDSKLLIKDGIAFVAYYASDKSIIEGDNSQKVRLSVFPINDPTKFEVFDVLEPNTQYSTLKTDALATYTPVIIPLPDGNIRIISRAFVNYNQVYCFRDFNVTQKSFTAPQICKFYYEGKKIDVDVKNSKMILESKIGKSYTNTGSNTFLFMTSDPVSRNNMYYFGLTVGDFTGNPRNNVGTTCLLNSNDFGKTFEFIGAPNPSLIDEKYNKQFVEASFDFVSENSVMMIGRNDLSGMFVSQSYDGGINWTSPQSLNDDFGAITKPSKPFIKVLSDGRILSIWSIQQNYVDSKRSFSDRTVLEIRCGTNTSLIKNKVIARIKSTSGCHYPSAYETQDKIYILLSGDSRALSLKNVADISITYIDKSELN